MELLEAIEILSDLGFTSVELAIHESGVVKPSELLADMDRSVQLLRHTHRLDISGYSVQLESTGEQHYEDFLNLCRLAKPPRW